MLNVFIWVFNVSTWYFLFVFAYNISTFESFWRTYVWMYNDLWMILRADRKAYSCPTKWLPQDSASSGKWLSFWLLPQKTALRRSLRCTDWVLLSEFCLLLKTFNSPNLDLNFDLCKKTIHANGKDKSGSVHFLLRQTRGAVSSVELSGFQFGWKCVSGWGMVCVCLCVCRCRRREKWKTEEDDWMYSAVIHKVESTTKLLATV